MVRFDAPRLIGSCPTPGGSSSGSRATAGTSRSRGTTGSCCTRTCGITGSWHLYRDGRAAGAAAPPGAGADRGRRAGSPSASTPRSSRRTASPTPPPPRPGWARPRPVQGRRRPRRCVDVAALLPTTRDARCAEVLLDQRVICGVGNVYRCEVLWASELSPFAPVGDLTDPDAIRLVNVAAGAACGPTCATPSGSPVPGVRRPGRVRPQRAALPPLRRDDRVPPTGEHARTLYWCPGCQVRLDPRRPAAATTPGRWTPTRPPPSTSPISPGAAPADPPDGRIGS